MVTEAQLVMERATLRWLAKQHPDWTQQDLATYLGRSLDWVKKWLKRFRQADPNDVTVLHSRSRARHTPTSSIADQPLVVQRILEIRDAPPENLQRIPGPEAILYYLHRDPLLQSAGVRLPCSQAPVWKILRAHGRIALDRRRKRRPQDLKEPGEEVQLDLKDAVTVAADPGGKQQHVVEVANFVDAGTSIWLKRVAHTDFHAETLLETVAQFFQEHGLPAMLTFDNDPRFVGSATGRDFPSALVRFLLCLGVEPNVCPPHRPDKNAYVERFHRTLGQECLLVHRPSTLEQVREVTERFVFHYNHERPNQARSCGNQPPRVACPDYPTLPRVPQFVDPDRWLQRLHRQAFARQVQAHGSVTINHEQYYVKKELAGQQVMLFVNVADKQFDIWHAGGRIKEVPIKGLHHTRLAFEEYVTLMAQQARSEYRQYLQTHPRLVQGRLWG
jgi:transposase InsO family protein